MPDPKKQARIEEVQALVGDFAREGLSAELTEYVRKLWAQIGRQRVGDQQKTQFPGQAPLAIDEATLDSIGLKAFSGHVKPKNCPWV